VSALPDDDHGAPTVLAEALPATEPRIGPYRLVRVLGHGGMGKVFLGIRDDESFHKRVAIKVLKRGMDTEAIVSRFRHERQVLASLNHPNIAALLDGGTTPNGLPYFAMEYIEGQNIVDFCESRKLDTTARLQLFRQVCSAVQYAHQNLIVHRDIKPHNVLVTSAGTPKLLDFGIAKLLNPELAGETLAPTAGGAQLMTPEYASPEQVLGHPVTTATDVYSLGVLLYELLTNRRPYRLASRTPADIARVVCESVPARPSTAVTQLPDPAAHDDVATGAEAHPISTTGTGGRPIDADAHRLRRRLAGDLDNIVLKALSKEPDRRYASADQFSEDVRRHLAGLPVIARPDTLRYRASKFVRRNRGAVVAGAVVFAALVAGVAGTASQARRANAERVQAEQRFDDVRRLANSLVFEVHDAIRDLPGSTPARKLLVDRGLEYLDKLARGAGTRADLRRELGGAYVTIGDVQGRPLTPNLGDTAGALASYKKAVALYESLGAATAPDPALRREVGTAYLRMGDALAATGDTRGALSFAQKGLTLHKEAGTAAAVSPAARRELAAAYSRVGDLLSATGNLKESLTHRRTALAIMQEVALTAPDDVANQRQLGIAFQKLGTILGNPNAPNLGDFAGALDQMNESAAIFRRAVAAHPDNASLRRNLAVVQSNTSDVLLALERPDEALARLKESLAGFEALAAADPRNAAATNDVAIGIFKVGALLESIGRRREALPEFERALALHLGLRAADPDNEAVAAQLASDYNGLATTQAKLGMREVSLRNHGHAIDMSRRLSAGNPSDIELRVALALALTGRGEAYAIFGRRQGPHALDDLRSAERDYDEAVRVLDALKEQGAIEGTDLQSLEEARTELARIREQIAR
jgi:eukaryotic-like serine/threonine-protein kinase